MLSARRIGTETSGITLVEMVAAIAIVAIMSTMAVWTGAGFLKSARTAKVAREIVDTAALARERALARYEVWRVRFVISVGSPIAQSFVVESCNLDPGQSGETSCMSETEWTQQGQPHLVEDGTVILLQTDVSGNPITQLRFDRNGRFLSSANVDMHVCVSGKTAGQSVCRSVAKTVTVLKGSGLIRF